MTGSGGVRTALLVVSDRASRKEREDGCGPSIRSFLEGEGLGLDRVEIIPDEKEAIRDTLLALTGGEYDLVLTAGGTGLSPRDVTPDATKPLLDREIPGIPEAMRAASMKVSQHAALSRAVAGMRGNVMIVNLPGSPKAAVENLGSVLRAIIHGIAKAQGDQSDCAT